MSDSDKRIKVSSVAAFLWMPQFRLSFQQFSFIMPVFVRTIAMMFEQAGLLPPNHPAIRYGVEGKKYKFSDLMGEAWFFLRSHPSTPYQWSLFASVVMMICFVILSFISVALNLSGMLMGKAHAQLFDNPLGATDIASMPPAGGGAMPMFANSIPGVGTAHGDFGIMLLDKMLRMGTVPGAGLLQSALGGLMQVYNSGILMIAGIMLFWIILSVVVDTAKTGHIGGGRHNMVWAPIRIVFALGLLIPLGTTGFSSGQFMVMKLAEWGSNFGTRGWVAYVNGLSGVNLVGRLPPENASGLVNQYVKMWVCRVAYNGFETQATNPPSAAQLIVEKSKAGLTDAGIKDFAFSNQANPNHCGTLTYLSPYDPALQRAAAGPDPTARAIAQYKQTMRAAYTRLFFNVSTPDGGSLTPQARALACAFVSQHIYGVPNPLAGAETCAGIAPACGQGVGGTATARYPNGACLTQLLNTYTTEITAATNAANGALQTFTASAGFMQDIEARGWAGMGMWYHRIAQLNSTVGGMTEAPISIKDGDIITEDAQSGVLGAVGSWIGIGSQEHKVFEVNAKYMEWWASTTSFAGVIPTPTGTVATATTSSTTDVESDKGGSSYYTLLKSFKSGSSSSIFAAVVNFITGTYNPFMVLGDPANAGLYPLALLTLLGDKMITYGTLMHVTLTVIGVVGAFMPMISAGTAWAAGPLAHLFGTVASALITGGILMAFYLPMLPFVKVALSVLSWMVAVFEAVMLMPIAALAHLTTVGEGIAGGGKTAWIIWLNMLTRPIMTVIGYVGAILVFNSFVVFFNESFANTVMAGLSRDGTSVGFFAMIFYTIIYVMVMYTVANSSFKLLDMIPAALFKYLGGQPDASFDFDPSGAVSQAGSVLNSGVGGMAGKVGSRSKSAEQQAKEKKAVDDAYAQLPP